MEIDKEEYKDYYKHVPYETFFYRILGKFEKNSYHTIEGVMQDFGTMLYNAAEYNSEDSFIVTDCKQILIHVTEIFHKVKKLKEDFAVPVFNK